MILTENVFQSFISLSTASFVCFFQFQLAINFLDILISIILPSVKTQADLSLILLKSQENELKPMTKGPLVTLS